MKDMDEIRKIESKLRDSLNSKEFQERFRKSIYEPLGYIYERDKPSKLYYRLLENGDKSIERYELTKDNRFVKVEDEE